jgi:bis(5'-nucleosyl)-tetraphosphatase (symmetrical)
LQEGKRMSTYAIGDLQGCFLSLEAMLQKIDFKPGRDRLWFVGDLVNRGAGSLECLRFVSGLGSGAVTVLGNHDLHLLAVAEGVQKIGAGDTLQPVLAAPDCDALLHWLRTQKLLHIEGPFAMVHAGLLPAWSWPQAEALAQAVESALRGPAYRQLLTSMYGNEPDQWHKGLGEDERNRLVINATTRMRIVDAAGRMHLKFKGALDSLPPGMLPWFAAPTVRPRERTVIAGHWSALGLYQSADFIGLDSGCVWGRELSAFRLEDRTVFQVPCAETAASAGRD